MASSLLNSVWPVRLEVEGKEEPGIRQELGDKDSSLALLGERASSEVGLTGGEGRRGVLTKRAGYACQ